MNDVLSYEVTTLASTPTSQHLKSSLLLWISSESNAPCKCDDTGEVLRFKFSSLDDAFRFRLRFDEAVLANN